VLGLPWDGLAGLVIDLAGHGLGLIRAGLCMVWFGHGMVRPWSGLTVFRMSMGCVGRGLGLEWDMLAMCWFVGVLGWPWAGLFMGRSGHGLGWPRPDLPWALF
jgi:hypothetical protein